MTDRVYQAFVGFCWRPYHLGAPCLKEVSFWGKRVPSLVLREQPREVTKDQLQVEPMKISSPAARWARTRQQSVRAQQAG